MNNLYDLLLTLRLPSIRSKPAARRLRSLVKNLLKYLRLVSSCLANFCAGVENSSPKSTTAASHEKIREGLALNKPYTSLSSGWQWKILLEDTRELRAVV